MEYNFKKNKFVKYIPQRVTKIDKNLFSGNSENTSTHAN